MINEAKLCLARGLGTVAQQFWWHATLPHYYNWVWFIAINFVNMLLRLMIISSSVLNCTRRFQIIELILMNIFAWHVYRLCILVEATGMYFYDFSPVARGRYRGNSFFSLDSCQHRTWKFFSFLDPRACAWKWATEWINELRFFLNSTNSQSQGINMKHGSLIIQWIWGT